MSLRLDAEEERQLKEVTEAFNLADKEHRNYTPRWDHFDGLYHNYRDWRNGLGDRVERDRDLASQAAKDWGADLFIPLTYANIETIVPRLVAADPDMTLRPPAYGREEDIAGVKALIQRQSEQMDFQLKLQSVGKSGLMYGLGVGKCFWRQEWKTRRMMRPATIPTDDLQYVPGEPTRTLVYDDPDYQAVDIRDFFWDPFGYDMRSIGFAIHRTWRGRKYVKAMMDTGSWKQIDDDDELRGLAGKDKYAEAWSGRRAKQNLGSGQFEGGEVFEVWEYHDGDRVITILGRKVPVQAGPNPHWHGEMPFQIFRPTEILHQFMGKGEIEPAEDIQEEMNTMRGQRRDAATFALNRSYFYSDGLVDPADLKIGPGLGVPVTGDPKDVIYPMPIQDLPASSYQEEDRLNANFDRTTGINDPQAINSSDTATQAQYVQQATSERIKLKTKRLSREVVRPAACQILYMDQQRIRDNRTIAVPQPPAPGQAEQRWAWLEVGPEQLQGEWQIVPDDASMQPDNTPQKRQDGMQLSTIFSNPAFAHAIDPRRLAEVVAKQFDVSAEELLAPEEPRVPPVLLDLLTEAGVPADLIQQAWEAAQVSEQTGERPNWPPQEVMQAHDDVAQEEMDRAVADATPEPPAGTAGSAGASGASSSNGSASSTPGQELVPVPAPSPEPPGVSPELLAVLQELANRAQQPDQQQPTVSPELISILQELAGREPNQPTSPELIAVLQELVGREPNPSTSPELIAVMQELAQREPAAPVINIAPPVINVDVQPGEPPVVTFEKGAVTVTNRDSKSAEDFDVIEGGKVVRTYRGKSKR